MASECVAVEETLAERQRRAVREGATAARWRSAASAALDVMFAADAGWEEMLRRLAPQWAPGPADAADADDGDMYAADYAAGAGGGGGGRREALMHESSPRPRPGAEVRGGEGERTLYTGYNPEAALRAVQGLVSMDDGSGRGAAEALAADLEARADALLSTLLNRTETELRTRHSSRRQSLVGRGNRDDDNEEAENTEAAAAANAGGGGGGNAVAQDQEAYRRDAFVLCTALWHVFTRLARELATVAVYLDKYLARGYGVAGPHRTRQPQPQPQQQGYLHRRPSSLRQLLVRRLQEAFSHHTQLLSDAMSGYQAALQECVRADSAAHAPRPGIEYSDDDDAEDGEEEGEEEEAVGEAEAEGRAARQSRAAKKAEAETEIIYGAGRVSPAPLTASVARLRAVRDLTAALDLYATRVHPVAAATVRVHYERLYEALWGTVSPRAYFAFAMRAMVDERRRAEAYLLPHTRFALEQAVHQSLLRLSTITEAMPPLMDQSETVALRRLWHFFSRSPHVPHADKVKSTFRKYVLDKGGHYMSWLGSPTTNVVSAASAHGVTTAAPKGLATANTANTTAGAAAAAGGGGGGGAMAAAVAADYELSRQPFATVRCMIDLSLRCEAIIAASFSDAAHEFGVQLHESLRTVLGQRHSREFAQQLAALLDATMRRVASGDLPLSASPATAQDGGGGASSRAVGLKRPRSTASGESSAAPSPATTSAPPSHAPSMTNVASLMHLAGLSGGGGGGSAASLAALERDVLSSARRPRTAEGILRNIGCIFSDHPHKEFFEQPYWRALAARLLRPVRPSAPAAEAVFVAILHKACGSALSSKFDGMLRDIQETDIVNEVYRDWVDSKGATGGGVLAIRLAAAAAANGGAAVPVSAGAEGAAPSPPTVPPPAAPSAAAPDPGEADTNVEDEEAEGEEGERPWRRGTAAVPSDRARLSAGEKPLPALPPPTAADFDGLPTGVRARLFILAQHHWPEYTPLPLTLPTPAWRRLADSMQLFYRHAYRKRCLTWLPQLSHATIVGSVHPPGTPAAPPPSSPQQFSGTLVQCAALMALDAALPTNAPHDRITVAELCRRLGTDAAAPEVLSGLRGLTQERFPMLLCTAPDGAAPHHGAPAPQDYLQFNPAFAPGASKVLLPVYSDASEAGGGGAAGGGGEEVPSSSEDEARALRRVLAERGFIVEAAIVRFLKGVRAAPLQAIADSMPAALAPGVTPGVVKECLEKLLGKGIVRRAPGAGAGGADEYSHAF